MVQDGTGWYRMVQDGTGWYRMVQDGTGWYRMVQDGTGNLNLCRSSRQSLHCRAGGQPVEDGGIGLSMRRSCDLFCQAAAGKIGAAIRGSATRWQAGEVVKVRPIKNSRPEISLLPLVQILANHDQFADWFLVSFNVANWQTYCEHVMVHCALSEYSRSRKTTTKLVFEQRGFPWNRYNILIHFVNFCMAWLFLQVHSLKHAFVIFHHKCHFLCSCEGSPFEPDELGFSKYVWNSAVEPAT